MQEKGIEPEDIKGIEDLSKLPFTYKQDLRDNYPFGTFAVPLSEIVRIHASSGTTGKRRWSATREMIWKDGPRSWQGPWSVPVRQKNP